ncbi:MAG: hypothetical protein WAU44_09055 [Nitrospira sp.]|jgi:hypothetical protein|nr:hypothetical protein [Nitrospira sp.]MBK8378435.1 hypothetical protein [Nitrospira sp.]MBP6198935.1 hypothetical protein [Nitrospira sp.]MBP6205031.1 hypothetical protein [Nitrospira sp.]MBP9633524.1 hypothetical protein [Nitrospira sp.]
MIIRLLLPFISLCLTGCIWPLPVAHELNVQVTDAFSSQPIPKAQVVYLACHVHDYDCSNGHLVRTETTEEGKIHISQTYGWGPWFPAAGGLPAPNHLIAIWAQGYSAFVFTQYGDSVSQRLNDTKRGDVRSALQEIPDDRIVNDELLNPRAEFIGGKIKLRSNRD